MQHEIKKNKAIEKYLNKVKFNDIKIGSLIAQYYALNLISRQHARPIIVNLLILTKYILTLWNIQKAKQLNADFLFTKLDNRFHFNALMDPLISHYRNNSIILCDENSFDKNKFSIHDIRKNIILFNETNSNSSKDSVKILKAILFASYLLLKNKKRLHLTFQEVIYFITNLLVQLRRVSFWDHSFTEADQKLSCVVTEYDRFSEVAPLVLAARKHKIKTITLIHGVLEDYSFTPFLAEYIFCWGEGQKSWLISKGIDPKRIFITGNPMFADKKLEINSDNHKNKELCICLAISPGFDNHTLIEPFVSALNLIKNARGILKLHPSLKKDYFKWVEATSSKIEVLASSDITNSDIFQNIDLLIINDSGIANEALAAGVPVTVLIPKDNEQINTFQTELIQLAGCKLATNESELVTIFSEIAAHPILFKSNALKMGEKYLKLLYNTTGKDSVNEMISQIDKISQIK